jgi:hypothetical protein
MRCMACLAALKLTCQACFRFRWARASLLCHPCCPQVSQYTPLSALRLGKLALEAGVPPGVVNILPGGRRGQPFVCKA